MALIGEESGGSEGLADKVNRFLARRGRKDITLDE